MGCSPTRRALIPDDVSAARFSSCRELRFGDRRRVSSTPTTGLTESLSARGCSTWISCGSDQRCSTWNTSSCFSRCVRPPARNAAAPGRATQRMPRKSTATRAGASKHRRESCGRGIGVVVRTSSQRPLVAVLASWRRTPGRRRAPGVQAPIQQGQAPEDAEHDLQPAGRWRPSVTAPGTTSRLTQQALRRACPPGASPDARLPVQRATLKMVPRGTSAPWHRQSSVFTP